MNGFVEVESEYGKGTTFTIYIPFIEGDAAQVEQSVSADNFVKVKADADVAVLVVDDIPINLTVALGFLTLHGITADVASGGEEAVRMVTTGARDDSSLPPPSLPAAPKRYDLIFMDHMMPEVDGIEASRRIRAWETDLARQNVPIIALSANAVTGARELFLNAGMNDFISKPIEAPALNKILAKWLPADKLTLAAPTEAAAAPLPEEKPTALWVGLNAIPGLNTADGVSHTGGVREGYYRVLRQFASGFDEGVKAIFDAVEREDWHDYAIRLHAYKGVMAIIGQKDLEEWMYTLEMAGKTAALMDTPPSILTVTSAIALIKGATPPICEEMADFRAALLAATLLETENPVAKTKITMPELMKELDALAAACAAFKAKEANEIVARLEKVSVDAAVDAALAELCGLAASLDYDEALERIAAFKRI
jgi:CheY-like chemotaxis protein